MPSAISAFLGNPRISGIPLTRISPTALSSGRATSSGTEAVNNATAEFNNIAEADEVLQSVIQSLQPLQQGQRFSIPDVGGVGVWR